MKYPSLWILIGALMFMFPKLVLVVIAIFTMVII